MGGQAFAHLSPPLSTPRMPPEIYTQVLTTIHAILRQHYRLVGSPIEAPGKETFGDVDILVFDPNPNSALSGITFPPRLGTQMASILGAKGHIVEKGNPTMNFAVPWPKQNDEGETGVKESKEKYIQLDVKVCESEKMFDWELFHGAHGDLWNILGSTIRKFGLTVNNLGMYLRIPEIELFDRKKSMVFLTDDRRRIIEFLGLDPEKWWRKFGSREEMFEYAAGCRMFWVKDLEDEAEEAVAVVMEGQEGGEMGKKKLKHNDRVRMAKRSIFRAWIDEFVPRCRAQGRFVEGAVTREQIRDEAFVQFGSATRTTYEARLSEWTLAKHTDDLWRAVIKGSVPEEVDPQFRAASIRTMKGVIMGGETFDGNVVPEVARNDEGFWDMDKVRVWVLENWKEAGEIGWARQRKVNMSGRKVTAEKKEIQADEKASKRVKVDDGEVT